MNHKEKGRQGIVLLKQAIRDYLLWMIDKGYSHRTLYLHERLLNRFSVFIDRRALAWENIFTFEAQDAFQKECKLIHVSTVIRGLARYLHAEQKISRPLSGQPRELPSIYEEYLRYYAKTRQSGEQKALGIRRMLTALHEYLTREKVELAAV